MIRRWRSVIRGCPGLVLRRIDLVSLLGTALVVGYVLWPTADEKQSHVYQATNRHPSMSRDQGDDLITHKIVRVDNSRLLGEDGDKKKDENGDDLNKGTKTRQSLMKNVPPSYLDRGCGANYCMNVEKHSDLIINTTGNSMPLYSDLQQMLPHPSTIFTSEAGDFRRYMANSSQSERQYSSFGLNKAPEYCKQNIISEHLPTVSVVIPFYNEMWSVFLRTIHSVLATTPPSVLHEIILIDDCSTSTNLRQPLEKYMADIPKIKLLRMKSRQGLIRTRMLGAKAAGGEVLVFLDAHVVCHNGWLEPLLMLILEEPKTLAVPVIDTIDPNTMEIRFNDAALYGSFNWELDYVWLYVNKDALNTKAIATQTTIGCAMVVSRFYFFELGGFDEEMEVWGGENLEISLKTWMCGGAVKISPCSKVSHLFRARLPYAFSTDIIYKNLQRVALTWMGPSARFYFLTTGKVLPMTDEDVESIRKRRELAKQLNCKPFDWYLETLDVRGLLPIPPGSLMTGQLRNWFYNRCLTSSEVNFTLAVRQCNIGSNHHVFHFIEKLGLLVNDVSERCLAPDNPRSIHRSLVGFSTFRAGNPEQKWAFDPILPNKYAIKVQGLDTRRPVGRFRLIKGGFRSCLAMQYVRGSYTVSTQPCHDDAADQYWVFTHAVHSHLTSKIDKLMSKLI